MKTKLVSISGFLWKVRDKDGNLSQGTKKKFEIAGFEIAGQILLSETVNAEGTDVFVRDSECSR